MRVVKGLMAYSVPKVLSSLTTAYVRIPLLLHFLAADRLHALKQTSMQDMLWAALMEPAIWAEDYGKDDVPKPVEQAPDGRSIRKVSRFKALELRGACSHGSSMRSSPVSTCLFLHLQTPKDS